MPEANASSPLPGVLLVVCIASVALAAQALPVISRVSPMMSAILIGIAVRNLLGVPAIARRGITASTKLPLRWGVVLLGSQLTVTQLFELGAVPFLMLIASVVVTYFFTVAIGSLLGVDSKLARLIGAGTAICGASAVIAANAVVRDRETSVAYALAAVTLCGTLTMLLYPLISLTLQLSMKVHGFWMGASVHEVAQVMAAADVRGAESTTVGLAAKLTRVLTLAPMLVLMGMSTARCDDSERAAAGPLPWFIAGFILMSTVASAGWLPATWGPILAALTRLLLCCALAAIGMETCIAQIRSVGLKPLLVALLASAFLGGWSLACAMLVVG